MGYHTATKKNVMVYNISIYSVVLNRGGGGGGGGWGGDLLLRGLLAMSRDTFGCHNLEEGILLALGARDAAKIQQSYNALDRPS